MSDNPPITHASQRKSNDAMCDDPAPTPPVEPEAGDCCGEGCVPCIFDLYEQAVERYREAHAAWCARHPDINQDR